MVETYLFWGFEYSNVLGKWQDARIQFGEAEKIISHQPDSFVEERARLLIGLGQVELCEGNLSLAENLLQEAIELIENRDLVWWRPVADYFMGRLYLSKGEKALARICFERGLAALAQTGSPDYKMLILSELSQLEDDEEGNMKAPL